MNITRFHIVYHCNSGTAYQDSCMTPYNIYILTKLKKKQVQVVSKARCKWRHIRRSRWYRRHGAGGGISGRGGNVSGGGGDVLRRRWRRVKGWRHTKSLCQKKKVNEVIVKIQSVNIKNTENTIQIHGFYLHRNIFDIFMLLSMHINYIYEVKYCIKYQRYFYAIFSFQFFFKKIHVSLPSRFPIFG